jgi:hypothetical protein
MENRISATLAIEDRDAILAAIQTIKTRMPFLLALSTDTLKGMPRMGDQGRAFVAKVVEVANQNPDFLPRSFDVEEMRKDLALFEAMQPIRLALSQLVELVDGTTSVAGSEAYASALAVYQYAKANGKTMGLEGAVDDMARRFGRKVKSPAGDAANGATA